MASDPLVSVRLAPGGRPQKTGHYMACLEADWNTFLNVRSQELHWNDSVDDVVLEMTVMDLDLLTGDDPLGVIHIPVMKAYEEQQIALQRAQEGTPRENGRNTSKSGRLEDAGRKGGRRHDDDDDDKDDDDDDKDGLRGGGQKSRRDEGKRGEGKTNDSRSKKYGTVSARPTTVSSLVSSASTAPTSASRPSTSSTSASGGDDADAAASGAKFRSAGDGSEEYLLVRVLRACNLPATDFQEDEITGEISRSSDPYVKLTCSGETWGTAVVGETVDPDFVDAGEEPFWFPVYSSKDMEERFELEWQKILPKLPVKVIGYTTDFKALEGVLDKKADMAAAGAGSKARESPPPILNKDGLEVVLTVEQEREREDRKEAKQRTLRKIARNVASIKTVLHEYYPLLCDGFEFCASVPVNACLSCHHCRRTRPRTFFFFASLFFV